MEILGVGPTELLFIVIIALIILGPKDMQKAGKTLGKWMRDIVTSDAWHMFQQTSRELRTLPNRLMREANDEVNKIGDGLNNVTSSALRQNDPSQDNNSSSMKDPNIPSPSQSIPTSPTPDNPPENKIEPSTVESTPNESDQQKDA